MPLLAVSAGDDILVGEVGDSGDKPGAPSDGSNTYTQLVLYQSGYYFVSAIYEATAVSTGVLSIGIAAASNPAAVESAFAMDIGRVGALDTTGQNSSDFTATSNVTLTTTTGGDTVFAVLGGNSVTASWAAPTAAVAKVDDPNGFASYVGVLANAGAAGTKTIRATGSGTSNWCMVGAAFKPTWSNSTPASHQQVQLLNQSANVSGAGTIRGVTNTWGYLNVSVPAGYWTLGVNASNPAAFSRFYQLVNVSATNHVFAVYLHPASTSYVRIGNGPTASDVGQFWVTAVNSSGQFFPGATVELLNGSTGSGGLLWALYANDTNASAHFYGMNVNYGYELYLPSSDALYAVNWGIQPNETSPAFSAGHHIFHTYLYPAGGTSWCRCTVTGTAVPAFGKWTITQNTTLSNGVAVLSDNTSSSQPYYHLSFVNMIVYVNYSVFMPTAGFNGSNDQVAFYTRFSPAGLWVTNSTLVALVPFSDTAAISNFRLVHSFLHYDANMAETYFQTTIPLETMSLVRWSVIQGFNIQSPSNQPFSTRQGVTGTWSNDRVLNSVVMPLEYANLTHVAFTNSMVFVETAFNVSFSTFQNFSLIVNEPPVSGVHGSGLNFYEDYMVNESYYIAPNANVPWPQQADGAQVALDSIIKSTNGPAFAMTGGGSLNQSTIIFSPVTGLSYNNTGKAVGPGGHSSGQLFVFPSHFWAARDNFSVVVPTGGYDIYSGPNDTYDNDTFWFTPTLSQIAYWDGAAQYTANHPLGVAIFSTFPNLNGNDTFTHNYYDAQAGVDFNGPNNKVDHNVFVNMTNYVDTGFVISDNQGTSPQDNTPVEQVAFDNNTVLPSWVNYSATAALPYPPPAPYASYGVNDFLTGDGGNGFAYGSFAYNTIWDQPTGPPEAEWQYFPSLLVGRWTNVSHNLFENEGLTGPSRELVAPFGADVILIAANTTSVLYDNWFLNLDNDTIPFVLLKSQPGYYITSNATNSSRTEKPLGLLRPFEAIDNHYYFSTQSIPGQAAVPIKPVWSNVTYPGHVERYQYAFMFIFNYSTTISQAQYIYNTSVRFPLSLPSPFVTPGGAYLWNIAPDVSITNGTPSISYATGLLGGPQPILPWDHYLYNFSVESSYVEIAVNSTHAPSITISLQTAPGRAVLQISNATTGNVLSATIVPVPTTGIVNTTFYPSNESGGVVIQLLSDNGFGVPGNVNLAPIIELVIAGLIAGVIIYASVNGRRRKRGAYRG